jgi:hypothetical protein
MDKPTFFEEYFVSPIRNKWRDYKFSIFNSLLERHGMDWGKYPMEEIIEMYHRHQDEINRN